MCYSVVRGLVTSLTNLVSKAKPRTVNGIGCPPVKWCTSLFQYPFEVFWRKQETLLIYYKEVDSCESSETSVESPVMFTDGFLRANNAKLLPTPKKTLFENTAFRAITSKSWSNMLDMVWCCNPLRGMFGKISHDFYLSSLPSQWATLAKSDFSEILSLCTCDPLSEHATVPLIHLLPNRGCEIRVVSHC